MIAPELAAYVSQARAAGLNDATIRKNLVDGGWDPAMVNEAVPTPAPAPLPTMATPMPPAKPPTVSTEAAKPVVQAAPAAAPMTAAPAKASAPVVAQAAPAASPTQAAPPGVSPAPFAKPVVAAPIVVPDTQSIVNDEPPKPPAAATDALRSLMPVEKTAPAPSAGLAAAAATTAAMGDVGGLNYASFWRKMFASLIDGVFIVIPLLLVIAAYAIVPTLLVANAQQDTTVVTPAANPNGVNAPTNEPAPTAAPTSLEATSTEPTPAASTTTAPAASCLSDADCGEGGYTCVQNRCALTTQLPVPAVNETLPDGSTPTGSSCLTGVDCGAGQTCLNNLCYTMTVTTPTNESPGAVPPTVVVDDSLGKTTLGASDPRLEGHAVLRAILGILGLLSLLWMFLYRLWYVGRRGATPGMRMLGLMTVLETEPARRGVGIGRTLGHDILESIISGPTMGITYWWQLVDERRRTVGDKIMHFATIHDPSKMHAYTTLAGIPERKKRWVWFVLGILSPLPFVFLVPLVMLAMSAAGVLPPEMAANAATNMPLP